MWSIGNLSSDARQPEVSLFLFNMPWQNQICIPTCFLLLKRRFAPKFVQNHRLKCAKSPLPVDVRSSLKTSLFKVLLKIMTDNGIDSPPMKVISNNILFVYSLRGPLIKIARGCHTQWYNYFNGTTLLLEKVRRYLVAFYTPIKANLTAIGTLTPTHGLAST